ncbi:MAG TPA: hypothetical protein VFC35_02320 [Gemmatimonadaceae bacterium]|nr:hypothetical protein [Gemmatimonadaceae bacterium]
MSLPPKSSEQRSEMMDPHRREERTSAATEIAGRLLQKGIDASADEDPALLADLLTAVENFESAVEANGGDLMVNSPQSKDPQNPEFVVPVRKVGESLEGYIDRIDEATSALGG